MAASPTNQQSNQLEQWNAWKTYQRPRTVRLRYRFWCALLLVACLAVPGLQIAFLVVEWRFSSEKHELPDVWKTLPFILLPIAFLVVAFWILIGHRQLVRDGEIAIAKVTAVRLGRRSPTVTYEFSDRSGQLISASSPDNTRKISVGMVVPIFYNPESPQTDQVALCGSFYEVSGASVASVHTGS